MWRRRDGCLGGGFAAAMIMVMCSVTGCVTAPTYQVSGAPPAGWPPFATPPSPPVCVQQPSSLTSPSEPKAPVPPAPSPMKDGGALSSLQTFPPQVVLATGNYAEFISENERRLQNCKQGNDGCDVALFNLGFAYAYADSPYRNLSKAATYFETLLTRYPESSYALQGKVWRSLILRRLTLEGDLRSAQANLRSKDAMIHTLQEQIQRLRELAIDMQKKERELLQLR